MYGDGVPKSFYRKAVNTIRRDFNKGIKEINKKAKAYIELPKIKPEGNGMYSQEVKGLSNENKEIIVTPQDTLLLIPTHAVLTGIIAHACF